MRRRLRVDDRAIEGLPVRLVIALVVGVAALSVMMGMIDDVGDIGVTEVDAEPDPRVIAAGGSEGVTFTVVGPDGEPVEDATVVVSEDTARLTGPAVRETTDEDGTVSMRLDAELAPNQDRGKLDVTIVPPSGSEYVDERGNTDIVVMDELR